MSPPALRLETVSGAAIAPLLPALARLRIAVFREWPYLYEGDMAYEERYLASYATSPGAALVVAFDGEEPVGVSTCQPMQEAAAEFRRALAGAGLDPARFCYFGESVLLPAWRGRGAGVGFFTAREAHARRLGLPAACFCAVVRDPDDPRRPPGHVPLDAFWRRRGYVPRPDIACTLSWKEIGQAEETPHRLSFWLKDPLEGGKG
ncbi:GNAT family N-acetyltransferase [Crenalkalicoccus roseus]|uniref:GNAT family N-acetyltransferase n=1 Tax=Crenalkalicoccus roseus TaxID=1485588 RepID=UPI00107FE35C|nr:GNAT family N-acetyltransferase [Crenalkalicoccus roseus]